MNSSEWSFRTMLLCVCFALAAEGYRAVAAGNGRLGRIMEPSAVSSACDAGDAGRREKRVRRLDYRIHRGYDGWKRPLPTHVKAQYAGGMGVMSFGCGWDYGRKCRWETDVMAGFLPKAYSDRTHTTFTLRQNYIPWSVRCSRRLAVEPFSCGLYVTLITGEDYWVREPDRYPGSKYYGFTSRLRSYLYVGQRFTYYIGENTLLSAVTLYYEFSANDLDIIAKFGNRSLALSDIIYFSVGIKLQLFSN